DALRLHNANRAVKVNPAWGGQWGSGIAPLLGMAEGLAQADKIPDALHIATQIANDSAQRLNAAYAIALEQVRLGDFAGALQTVSDIPIIPAQPAVQRNFKGRARAETRSATQRDKAIVRANVARATGLAQLAKDDRKAALATLDKLRQWNQENAAGAEP